MDGGVAERETVVTKYSKIPNTRASKGQSGQWTLLAVKLAFSNFLK